MKLNPTTPDNQFWRRGDSASLAVGQGDVLVTPLQLANGYAAFANGGTLYQPRLADEVTESSARAARRASSDPVVHPLDPLVKRHHRPHARGPRARSSSGPRTGVDPRPGRHRGGRVQQLPGRCR